MASSNQWMSYASRFMETEEDSDLQQRLGLYQVFLKLYEHHRELLNEILSLEGGGSQALASIKLPYIQGMMLNQPYLVTNLLDGKTQALLQPESRWIIGRNSQQSTIAIADRRLSRTHAAIEYGAQGFYLADLNSSNGTFVNGEPIRQPVLLKDGDRVRLGSLSFIFFQCTSAQVLASDRASSMPLSKCSSPVASQFPEGVIAHSPASTTTFADQETDKEAGKAIVRVDQDNPSAQSPLKVR